MSIIQGRFEIETPYTLSIPTANTWVDLISSDGSAGTLTAPNELENLDLTTNVITALSTGTVNLSAVVFCENFDTYPNLEVGVSVNSNDPVLLSRNYPDAAYYLNYTLNTNDTLQFYIRNNSSTTLEISWMDLTVFPFEISV